MAHLFVELPQEAVSFSGESSFSSLRPIRLPPLVFGSAAPVKSIVLHRGRVDPGRHASVTF